MACVPPRAGSDTAQQFPIAQGVPLSKHGKMKQILARSSLWHKSCRGWPPVWNVRNMASEAVVVEEMEASDASEKKTMRWQRWQAHETMVLIAAKKQQDLRGLESTEAAGVESKKNKNKWKEIETICREKGIERSAQQCQARWFRLVSAFTQIRSWEETRKPEQPSFWSLKLDERKTMGFLPSLDQNTYDALDELYNIKTDATENALVKDDGETHETNSLTSGLKSDEMVQAECLNISKPICEENNERYVRDAEDNFFSEELEECKGEKQADQCKAMESTKILIAYLGDDSNEAQLLHANAGKVTNLHTGQREESLKVSGIADRKDVNDEAQLFPASAEMIDGSNEDLCQGSLVVVDDSNKAQLLHASAGKVDCNPMNLHTGQQAESLKVFGIAEHTSPIDKNEKGKDFFEVCEDKYPLCPESAEDILTGRADNIQSNCIEAQNKNDASQTVEVQLNNLGPIIEEAYVRWPEMVLHTRPEQQPGDFNPLRASKEEICTGVVKQVPEDISIFPRSEIFESFCSAQEEGSEKIELQTSEEGHIEMIADMAERNATMLECSTSFEEKKVGHLQDDNNEYNGKTSELSQNIEHFKLALKDVDSYVEREPCDQSQSVDDRGRSDTIERMKVAIKEGEYLTEKIEIRGSTVDANPPALTCIQHQFQHAGFASEEKSTMKGDCGSFESVREAKRSEVLEVAAKELEFTIKDDRVNHVTSVKGSKEDQSKKMTTSSKTDEDVFMYIPAATGNLVRFAVQTIRKFFKF